MIKSLRDRTPSLHQDCLRAFAGGVAGGFLVWLAAAVIHSVAA